MSFLGNRSAVEDTKRAASRTERNVSDAIHDNMAPAVRQTQNALDYKAKRLSVDLGDPALNRVADGFLNAGLVGLSRGIAIEGFKAVQDDSGSSQRFEDSLKRATLQGLEWGAVTGAYSGLQHGIEKVRDRRDWLNGLFAGAATGALYAAARNDNRTGESIFTSAVTGAALATTAELLREL